jgi:hypothetical protein
MEGHTAFPSKTSKGRYLIRPIHKYKNNIKTYFTEAGCESVKWISFVQFETFIREVHCLNLGRITSNLVGISNHSIFKYTLIVASNNVRQFPNPYLYILIITLPSCKLIRFAAESTSLETPIMCQCSYCNCNKWTLKETSGENLK